MDDRDTAEKLRGELAGLRKRLAELEARQQRLVEAERALKESESTARALLDASADRALLVGRDGTILALNGTAARALGRPARELVGLCAHDLAPPELAERRRQVIADIVRSGRPASIEECRAGRQLRANVQPVFDAGGRVSAVAVFSRDVTEQQQSERHLRQSEQLYRTTIDAMEHPMHVVGPDLTIVLHNEAVARWCRDLGLEGSVVGRPVFEVCPFLTEEVRDEYRQVFETARPLLTDETNTVGGKAITTETVKTPVVEDGKVVRVVTVIRDVTPQRLHAEARRESEARFRSVFEKGPVGMAMVSDGRRLLEVNDALCEMLGYAPGELVGRNVAEITHPDDVDVDLGPAREVLEGRAPRFRLEKRYLRKDGQVVWGALSSTVIRDARGQPLYALSVVEDITAATRARQALAESEKAQRRFGQRLAALHAVMSELSVAESMDELCRQGVELAREKLGFDRISLWLLAGPPCFARGTFGIDEAGQLRDERHSEGPVEPESIMGRVLRDEVRLAWGEDAELRDNEDRVVGRGEYAIASLWDGRRIIGCVCVDNLLIGETIGPNQRELLALYASSLGHLCSHVRADEALRDSEERYRSLVQNLPGAVYRSACKPTWAVEFISDVVEDLCGYPASDFIGSRARSFASVVHPQDLAEVRGVLVDAVRRRQPYELEYRLLCAGGGVRWVHDKGRAVFGDDGEVLWLDGAIFDVTERKQAEQELLIRNSAIESSLNAVALADLDGKLTYVNSAFLRLWGYDDAEEAVGRPAVSFWHGREGGEGVLAAVLARGSWNGELKARRKDGSDFEVAVLASLVRNDAGAPVCLIGAFVDITQRKHAEEATRHARDRLQYVIDNTSDVIFEMDLAGNYTFTNVVAERITGYPAAELLKMNMGDLLAPEWRQPMFERLRRRVEGQSLPQPFTFEIVRRDGQRVTLELATTEVRRGGKLTGVQGIARDVTDRVRAERALRAARARLAGAREEERRRLAGELHDTVGQGLVAVRLGMQALTAAPGAAPADAQLTQAVRALCRQADDLVADVRRVCRGLYPATLESLGLGSALHQLAQDFKAQLQVDLQCRVPDDLGRFPTEVEIALFRIAQEAVTNAIRHGRARRVALKLTYEKGRAVLAVLDDGSGFNPQKVSGQGLGLTMMADRAQAVGGGLKITSRRGRTRVTATVPAEMAPPAEPAS